MIGRRAAWEEVLPGFLCMGRVGMGMVGGSGLHRRQGAEMISGGILGIKWKVTLACERKKH